ncbi:LLM class flavin-dependent oxidoreductase [Bradyrhizobium oropedii]|uniref:LLM class flavin-dependent oxidoreductase n=1 Tax=Bradyrhizobium oropedii TaxID=1571201 RepID=UPI001E34CDD9|nr:LLM class flavin-dependent oxidoreductase [Bradyrhizobium oropedii]
MDTFSDIQFEVFSTCPQSGAVQAADYVERVKAVARWSEEAGCKGILVYTENSLVDPWLVSQIILESTRELCPLVAVQPVYMHPYSVAKMVSSLAHMYGRRLYLNMVAGGYTTELAALGDATPHDKRYARLIEYTGIIKLLLENAEPVTREGESHVIRNLRMTPPLPRELLPGIFVSGSSEAGLAAAKALGATPVKYPKPAVEYGHADAACTGSGVRVGIIARSSAKEAWRVAHERFPTDRKGQLAHKLAMKVSDSAWHKQMSDLAAQTSVTHDTPYWLVPFENYKTFCPYLVGDYRVVSDELARYAAAGYRTFILDIPPTREELVHTGEVFGQALTKARRLMPSALRDPARQGLAD